VSGFSICAKGYCWSCSLSTLHICNLRASRHDLLSYPQNGDIWTPCGVHSLNLMLSKMGIQIGWTSTYFEEAKEIQGFITNHHMSQGIYQEFAKLELLKVPKLCFIKSRTLIYYLGFNFFFYSVDKSRFVNHNRYSI
jgi:hypothetical protein